jgi:hypothetical protein
MSPKRAGVEIPLSRIPATLIKANLGLKHPVLGVTSLPHCAEIMYLSGHNADCALTPTAPGLNVGRGLGNYGHIHGDLWRGRHRFASEVHGFDGGAVLIRYRRSRCARTMRWDTLGSAQTALRTMRRHCALETNIRPLMPRPE